MSPQAARTVDVREMTCAQALAQLSGAMKAVPVGAIIELVCTTPDVRDDVISWARALGHALMETEARDGATGIWIRKFVD